MVLKRDSRGTGDTADTDPSVLKPRVRSDAGT